MHECKHGCGYTNKHRGAMNLHEQIHCKTLKGSSAPAKKELRYCDCDGGPSWSFLNRFDRHQAAALQAGYKKICTECGEVV